MRDTVISVGVIGCGEIAQLMHLPYIHELPSFRVAALCDTSPGTLAKVGAQYGVGALYTDYRDLLANRDVDAVAICNYDHGAIVGDALAAGKHLIVEKPLVFTPAEARPLVKQAEKTGLVALVGYMKLFDPGYEVGLERVAAIGKPKSIHVHDFAGRRVEAALGPNHRGYRDLYMTLLMLGSHDLAVLRGAFGSPQRVAFARPVGSAQLLAALDYPNDVPCVLDIGVAQYEWWDEWLHVHGERDEVRIEFQNPYWRHASAVVRLHEALLDGPSERVIPGVPDTSFRREWKHFADCLLEKKEPRTPLAGGLADLDLAVALIHAMPPKEFV
jgi:predicted dehydrogenase